MKRKRAYSEKVAFNRTRMYALTNKTTQNNSRGFDERVMFLEARYSVFVDLPAEQVSTVRGEKDRHERGDHHEPVDLLQSIVEVNLAIRNYILNCLLFSTFSM